MPETATSRFSNALGMSSRGRSRRAARSCSLCALVIVWLAGAACTPPGDMSTAQALMDLGDAVTALREETVLLQVQLDSMRTEIARQDTVIARLADASGVALPPR